MKRQCWIILINMILVIFTYDVNREISYKAVSDYFLFFSSSWEWYTALAFFVYGLEWLIIKWEKALDEKGTVTPEGIYLRNSGQVVTFADICKLIAKPCHLATIFVTGGQIDAGINRDELIKMARTRMNQWSIDDKVITVLPGEPGESFEIRYRPTGKYNSGRFLSVEAFFFIVLGFVAMAAFDIIPLEGLGVLVLFAVVLITLAEYKDVGATIYDERLIIKDENLTEHVMPFADVKKMEKGLAQVKVTGRNGKAVYFPRAFYLLPELVEELAGLSKDKVC